MITMEDCIAFCEADPRKVDEIAREEHLVAIMALACAQCRSREDCPVQSGDAPRLGAIGPRGDRPGLARLAA